MKVKHTCLSGLCLQGPESHVCLVFLGTPPSSTTRGTAAMARARWRPTSGQRTRRWCRPTGGVRTWSTRKDGHAQPPDLSGDSSCHRTPYPALHPGTLSSVLTGMSLRTPETLVLERRRLAVSVLKQGAPHNSSVGTSEDGGFLIPTAFRCPS